MKTVLVAEDEAITLRLFQYQLTRAGFIPMMFRDGLEVVERARRTPPDLAILDYNLPGRNGLELIEGFKADEVLKWIPIIVVTGFRDPDLRRQFMEAGAADVICKPFSPAALNNRIRELIGVAA